MPFAWRQVLEHFDADLGDLRVKDDRFSRLSKDKLGLLLLFDCFFLLFLLCTFFLDGLAFDELKNCLIQSILSADGVSMRVSLSEDAESSLGYLYLFQIELQLNFFHF